MDTIDAIGTMITDISPDSRADLKNPELAIVVEVMAKQTCVSIVRDFNKLRKYNLQECASGLGRKDVAETEKVPSEPKEEVKVTEKLPTEPKEEVKVIEVIEVL